jgi:hypothetical protein
MIVRRLVRSRDGRQETVELSALGRDDLLQLRLELQNAVAGVRLKLEVDGLESREGESLEKKQWRSRLMAARAVFRRQLIVLGEELASRRGPRPERTKASEEAASRVEQLQLVGACVLRDMLVSAERKLRESNEQAVMLSRQKAAYRRLLREMAARLALSVGPVGAEEILDALRAFEPGLTESLEDVLPAVLRPDVGGNVAG